MSFPWEARPECTCVECVDTVAATEPRPELQRDAKGMYPGEAEHGVPDFLRTFRASLAKGPPATNRQS